MASGKWLVARNPTRHSSLVTRHSPFTVLRWDKDEDNNILIHPELKLNSQMLTLITHQYQSHAPKLFQNNAQEFSQEKSIHAD